MCREELGRSWTGFVTLTEEHAGIISSFHSPCKSHFITPMNVVGRSIKEILRRILETV